MVCAFHIASLCVLLCLAPFIQQSVFLSVPCSGLYSLLLCLVTSCVWFWSSDPPVHSSTLPLTCEEECGRQHSCVCVFRGLSLCEPGGCIGVVKSDQMFPKRLFCLYMSTLVCTGPPLPYPHQRLLLPIL